MQVGDLYATLRLDTTQFNSGVAGAGARFNALAQQMGAAGGGLGRLGGMLGSLVSPTTAAVAAVGALVTGLGALTVNAVRAAGDMEQVRLAFETMLGSAAAANDLLNSLEEFGAKTPFEMTDLIPATQKLIAFGFAASDVIPILRDVGDAAAGLNLGGAEIQEIIGALGKMQAAGKATSEVLTQQLAARGIPAWRYLADLLGVDVAEAQRRVERGAVDAATAIAAIRKGMQADFGGLMEKQSKTFLGRLSTIRDGIAKIVRDVGALILPAVTPLLSIVEKILDAWPQVMAAIKSGMAQIAPYVAEIREALKPLTAELGQLARRMFQGGLRSLATMFRNVATTLKIMLPIIKMAASFLAGLVAAFLNLMQRLSTFWRFLKLFGDLGASVRKTFEAFDKTERREQAAAAAEEAAMASEEEARAVLDVARAEREARVEAEKRRLAQIGWMGLRDIYERAQVAAQKFAARPGELAPMTAASAPSDAELRRIYDTLRRQEEQQAELLRITRERLATYA